tara:strand:+ start:2109 stop:2333 length:225 start_codon:yes stop_codon:yes gene_type:complete
MTNEINKKKDSDRDLFNYTSSGYAFIKKENNKDEDCIDIFNVYGSDGVLLAGFENEDTAIAAIIQSGLEPTSLH